MNKTYLENFLFMLGSAASLRNALLTNVFSSVKKVQQTIDRASIIKVRPSSYLFLIQQYNNLARSALQIKSNLVKTSQSYCFS